MGPKNFDLWFKILVNKAYFEKGYGLSHYLFKLIAVIGVTSNDMRNTLISLIGYSVGCYILGAVWYHFRIIEVEYEVRNRYDPFIREMRSKTFK